MLIKNSCFVLNSESMNKMKERERESEHAHPTLHHYLTMLHIMNGRMCIKYPNSIEDTILPKIITLKRHSNMHIKIFVVKIKLLF